MDAGHKSNRKYPAYTTAELEAAVAAGNGNPVMVAEIAARKAGTSNVLVVPQIVRVCKCCDVIIRKTTKGWRHIRVTGCKTPEPKIGRM